MYDQILARLSAFIQLDKEEAAYFTSLLQVKQFKIKELILAEGSVCKHSYFINSGCIRFFHTVEGLERTGQFFFENGWYTDYESYLSGRPSRQNIEAIEKTELLLLAKADLDALFTKLPKFERFGRLMAENAYLGTSQTTLDLATLSPEERYLKLIKERPKVMQRVPLKYIASYLAVQPESLSRIRKRLLE